MVMDEKSTSVKIIHSITDLFSAAGATDNYIGCQVVVFRSYFIGDQLHTMVQVTNSAFKNIKLKAP